VSTLFLPELLYTQGAFVRDGGLLVDDAGRVIDVPVRRDVAADLVIELPRKCLLPGFVNAHSHSFQRLIRGKAESRIVSGKDFWSWRGTMYHAAAQLDARDVFDVARMAFLEMALAGTTTVGEFHYLHTAPDGSAYEDPNLLAKQVIAAAQSVGIRIVLLRTAYLRSGFELLRDRSQTRFFESASDYLANMERLIGEYPDTAQVTFGVAPHSVRAVPLDALRRIMDWSRSNNLPLHMHVSEQVAENAACIREYGCTPIELLHREKLLGADFTAVHAIHISQSEISTMAETGASICACPTTERNLGDGVLAADAVMSAGIPIALGSDSQAQIDPLEDARELDYHLRLVHQKRAILDQIDGEPLAGRLFQCTTKNGARALSVLAGELAIDSMADFFTVDLDDVSVAGFNEESLLSTLVFSLQRSAIRDVAVNGKLLVRNGKHALQQEIVGCYQQVHEKVWRNRKAVGVDE
jgi:formimidoylglutamate deiminase